MGQTVFKEGWKYFGGLRQLKANKFSRFGLAVFVVMFCYIGLYYIFASHAAGNLSGDINNDGVVNVMDLSYLLSSYGNHASTCATNSSYTCDLNSDTIVNIFDLSILLSHYGQTVGTTPSNTSLPTISGTTTQGQTLSATTGTWTGSPTSYGYQWQDCDTSGANCGNINGATSSNYALTSNDVNHTIRVVVTATNSSGSGSATSAATTTVGTVTINPGPIGDFFWKGLNWTKRADAGSPAYNGKWSTSNIVGPDSNGYLTLEITNPTGSSPVSSEIDSTRQGFGYGTYTTTVATRLDNMNKALVFGCLFTYDDYTSHASHNEIDVCETSAWDISSNPVTLEHTYYTDTSGDNGIVDAVPIPSDVIMTHRMVWSASKITWDSYIGAGTNGTLIRHTERTSNIPVPYKEAVVFNLWAFDNGAANAAPFNVVLRDFSFVPASGN